MEPNKENIRTWVDALRSGDYTQDVGQLKTDAGYCCLGVACEVSGAGRWVAMAVRTDTAAMSNDAYVTTGGDRNTGVLPCGVRAWLGLNQCEPTVGGRVLTSLNDSDGLSFTEIADLIEAEWLS